MDYTVDKKLQGFQLIAQEKLQAIIGAIPGKKDLILEPSLIKPLEHICSASWLKLKGIQHIYKFDAAHMIPRTDEQVQIFMIRSEMATFHSVLRQIQQLEEQQPTDMDLAVKNYHVICTPRSFTYYQCLLEEEGLYGLTQLHHFNWDFIHLDEGVLSMEVPNLFSAVFLNEDTSLLTAVAHSLRVLQMSCGRPDLILTFGDHAANIMRMLNTFDTWDESKEADFSAMLIIDRDKDYAASLLTPAIYAGLLLEVFHQRAGEICVEAQSNKILTQKKQIFIPPKKQLDSKPQAHQPINIRLNSLNDEIYKANRYKHFVEASAAIRSQAKAIGLEVQKLNDMKLDEMHDYVAHQLPKITDMKAKVLRHLNASEKVIEMLAENFRKVQALEEDILNNVSRKRIFADIDELLTTDGQKFNTLRLLCLLHLCSGIAIDELTQFVRNYCNYFGVQHLVVFQHLAKAGLLPALAEDEKLLNTSAAKLLSNLPIPKFQQTEFQANANRLRLMVSSAGADTSSIDVTNSTKKNCPSYVFNSLYIPLAAQLSSFLLKSASAEDLSSKLSMVDKIQLHFPVANHEYRVTNAKSFPAFLRQHDVKDVFPLKSRKLFIFIVGGVTYAEIGACHLIEQLEKSQIVIASDSIVSGADLISGAFI